jgi:hypothetical protein
VPLRGLFAFHRMPVQAHGKNTATGIRPAARPNYGLRPRAPHPAEIRRNA